MHFCDTQKRGESHGEVIQKLNKVIELILDKRTKNTMLIEPWTNNYAGELAICTKYENGTCSPIFKSLFEAQYYCESLGDDCVGVSENKGEFTTRKRIVSKSEGNSTSSVKAMWCSDSIPAFSVKLPSVFSTTNQVRVMWPVVYLKDMLSLMKRSSDEYLSRVHNESPLTRSQFDRFGLNITIMADTVVVDDDITFFNVRKFTVIARKMILKKKSILSFRQVQVSSAWEPLDTAAEPDPGNCQPKNQGSECSGIDGENGADGFPATSIDFDLGCINGNENNLILQAFSGNGGKGQHGSRGIDGRDGWKEPDLNKWAGTDNVCGWFSGCGSCCRGISGYENDDRFAIGHDSKKHGSSGGDGGNGGEVEHRVI